MNIGKFCSRSYSKRIILLYKVPSPLQDQNYQRSDNHSAYFTFCESYNWPSRLENSEFVAFIDPSNQLGQLLLCHFVAIQLLQQCSTDFVWAGRDTSPPSSIIVAWLLRLNDNIPQELSHFNVWPMKIAEAFGSALDSDNLNIRLGPVNLKVRSPTGFGSPNSPRNFTYDMYVLPRCY